jgi:hypothetical protein
MSFSPTLRSLADVFASIPDPRKPRGVRHPLGALLSLTVVGLLCGAENPEQISRFAANHPDLLAPLGFRPPKRARVASRRGVIAPPSNDMVARALALVDGAMLNRCLGEWLGRLVAPREMAAIDGKALRGQGDHVLSVYCPSLAHVLWQEGVGEKENELSALLRILPQLLDMLAKVRLFTGDAGFCHKAVAAILVEKRRDYLLQLKAPHTTDVRLAARPQIAVALLNQGGRARKLL